MISSQQNGFRTVRIAPKPVIGTDSASLAAFFARRHTFATQPRMLAEAALAITRLLVEFSENCAEYLYWRSVTQLCVHIPEVLADVSLVFRYQTAQGFLECVQV